MLQLKSLLDKEMRFSRSSSGYLLVVLVGIFLLGSFLRTVGLGSSSFWLDEIHSYERASQQSCQAMYRILLHKNHAPLYAFLLHYWIKLGSSEFVLRFFTVILGVINIAVTYALGRKLAGSWQGILGAFLLAVSPLHLYYSREARMYVLAALLVTLSLYFLYKSIYCDAWNPWVGYVVCTTLGLYTHYYSGFTFIAIGLFLTIRAVINRNWHLLGFLALANISVGVLFAPWLPTFWSQLQSNPLPWISRPDWEFLHRTFTRFFLHHAVLGVAYPVFSWALVSVLVVPFIVLAIRRLKSLSLHFDSYLFAAVCSTGPIILAIGTSLFIKPVIFDRYFVLTAPVACILLAQSIVQISQFRWSYFVTFTLLVGILISTCGVVTIQWKEDWKSATSRVKNHSAPHDIVIFGTEMHRVPFNYYYLGRNALPQYALPTDWQSRYKVEQKLDSMEFDRLWMVRTKRFNGSDKVADFVVSKYGDQLLSCWDFGGRYQADVCLYARKTE